MCSSIQEWGCKAWSPFKIILAASGANSGYYLIKQNNEYVTETMCGPWGLKHLPSDTFQKKFADPSLEWICLVRGRWAQWYRELGPEEAEAVLGTDGLPSSASLRWRQKTIWTRARSARGTVKEKKENAEGQGDGVFTGGFKCSPEMGRSRMGESGYAWQQAKEMWFFFQEKSFRRGLGLVSTWLCSQG